MAVRNAGRPTHAKSGRGPRPGLGCRTEDGGDRVSFNILNDPEHFVLVARPVIVRLVLPEGPAGASLDLVDATGSIAFQALSDLRERPGRPRLEKHMHMICHHAPGKQVV